jgi:hypothetical protein
MYNRFIQNRSMHHHLIYIRFRPWSSVSWGLGFGVWGLGFGVWGLGFWGIALESRVWGLGFGVWGLGFGVWGLGFGAWGLELGALGLGFTGYGVWGRVPGTHAHVLVRVSGTHAHLLGSCQYKVYAPFVHPKLLSCRLVRTVKVVE